MKATIKILFIITFLLFFVSCEDFIKEKDDIDGSGNVIMLEKSFTNFSELEFGYAIEVELYQADDYSVQIWIDDNLEKYLVTQKGRNNLSIKLNDDNNYNDYTFRAKISMPDLTSLEISGASTTDLFDFENQHDMTIELSGASKLYGDLITDDLRLDISGASLVELEGTGDDLDVNASGASVLKLGDYEVNDVNLNLSGASVATIFANVVIDAGLSGASVLNWKGDAQIRNITSTGASVINHIQNP